MCVCVCVGSVPHKMETPQLLGLSFSYSTCLLEGGRPSLNRTAIAHVSSKVVDLQSCGHDAGIATRWWWWWRCFAHPPPPPPGYSPTAGGVFPWQVMTLLEVMTPSCFCLIYCEVISHQLCILVIDAFSFFVFRWYFYLPLATKLNWSRSYV